jgi:hypothetical protein
MVAYNISPDNPHNCHPWCLSLSTSSGSLSHLSLSFYLWQYLNYDYWLIDSYSLLVLPPLFYLFQIIFLGWLFEVLDRLFTGLFHSHSPPISFETPINLYSIFQVNSSPRAFSHDWTSYPPPKDLLPRTTVTSAIPRQLAI